MKRGALTVTLALVALLVGGLFGKFAGIMLFIAGGWVLGALVKSSATLTGYAGLVANGLPARGILLEVSPIAISTQGGQLKTRTVRLDVEVPGQPPFEVQGPVMMPSNLSADVIPGATMELRLDPKDQSKIAIVGPGVGFVGGPSGPVGGRS